MKLRDLLNDISKITTDLKISPAWICGGVVRDKVMGRLDNISDLVGIPRFIVKTRYLSKIQGLGKAFIASKLEALCLIDTQLRLFKGDKRILLERFIFSFK